MSQAYQKLLKLNESTHSLSSLVANGDLEEIVSHLHKREILIKDLQTLDLKLSDVMKNGGRNGKKGKLAKIIESIVQLDKSNREVINQRMNNISNSLNELSKEKETLKHLRSIANRRRKQIIDVLY